MRVLPAAVLGTALALSWASAALASARSPIIALYYGLGGRGWSDGLDDIGAGLVARGLEVRMFRWWQRPIQPVRGAAGHSLGAIAAARAPCVVTIDGTWNAPPPDHRGLNFYQADAASPLGHWRVPSATNVRVPGVSHVTIDNDVGVQVRTIRALAACR